ncbi:MAG: extracellular solute-binding protein [Candidatus Eisenbacteria bacterium]|nr:extracellular solute-binding protein [Candidatus Eisenbacteria bacterium]
MCVLALALSGASCQKQSGTKIVFWQFWSADVINPIIAQFEKANPGITVEMQQLTWQNGFEKIVAAVSSGTQPDLCELGSTWVPKFAADGVLADLTSDVADMRDDYLFWDSCTLNDTVFGIPWVAGTRALFYNKELFAKAGLDPEKPPKTWAELSACAKKIHASAAGVYGFGLNTGERYILFKKFMPLAWGNGGAVLTADMRRPALYSVQNIQALDFYRSLKPYSLVEKQDVLDMAFKQGKLGMMISGGWNLSTVPSDAPQLKFGVALVPRPAAGRGSHASFAGSEILVTFAKSKHKAEALKLARFLVSRDNVIALSRAAKSVQPALRGAEDDPYYETHPLERTFVIQLKTAVAPPAHPKWVEIEDEIDAAVEEVLYDRKASGEALLDAHKKIEDIISRP